jgi:hypothetical protein
VAAALLDETKHHRQTQAGAFALLFGGKKGFKNLGADAFLHAHAGVADGQPDVAPGPDTRLRLAEGFVEDGIARLDG